MELVQLIVQKKWNGRKRSETVGNGRKRSETWSGQNLSNPHFFWNRHFRATPFFFECLKVSKGKRLETVGDRTFDRQKRHVSTQFSNIVQKHTLLCYPKPWGGCVYDPPVISFNMGLKIHLNPQVKFNIIQMRVCICEPIFFQLQTILCHLPFCSSTPWCYHVPGGCKIFRDVA